MEEPEMKQGVLFLIAVASLATIAVSALRPAVHSLTHTFGAKTYYVNETVERTAQMPPHATLTITHAWGDVSVQPWDRPEVKVVAKKHIGAHTPELAKRYAANVTVAVSSTSEGAQIVVNRPRTSFPDMRGISVDLAILAPRSAGIRADSSWGKLAVEGLTGPVVLGHRWGDAELRNIAGPVEATTKWGALRVYGIERRATIESKWGDVQLALAPRFSGDASRVANAWGDTTIIVPKSANVQLVANTQHGSIESEYPLEMSNNGTTARGRFGSGGPKMEITNSWGDVRIAQQ
jgi:hypothetical protein